MAPKVYPIFMAMSNFHLKWNFDLLNLQNRVRGRKYVFITKHYVCTVTFSLLTGANWQQKAGKEFGGSTLWYVLLPNLSFICLLLCLMDGLGAHGV